MKFKGSTRLFQIKKFPISMAAVKKNINPEKKDLNFWINKKGMIQIFPRVPLKKLYKYQHNEGTIGNTWKKHHLTFFNFCKQNLKGDILELGGGSNSISKLVKDFSKINKFVCLGKNIKKEKINNKIEYINSFYKLKNKFEKFDIILHSHLFEHVYDVNKFLKTINLNLKDNGLHIFTMPNMKSWVKSGLANAVSFEHPYYYDQELVKNFLEFNKFKILKKIQFGKQHSIMFKTKKVREKRNFNYNKFKYNKKLFEQLFSKWKKDVDKINKNIQKKKSVYLFGGHIFSQLIIYLQIDKDIKGILDNDPKKQNKFLYGTRYKIYSPNILKNVSNPYVYMRVGAFSNEIKDQIKKINKRTVFI
tara:strand:+ start:1618 stop:2700 length:1083 start_codon:yes stop_codon:yes gene_type:complete